MNKSGEPSFEEMLTQLESVISAVEGGKIGLEEVIGQYEKGMALIKRCRTLLAQAENRIQSIQIAEDGSIRTSPMESPD
ncbi:MAG: exodeoxyribonuclease VII small subunit [Phycisphaerales bacterium]|nr:exodeoxyribonuclease VII small subunit [Phycisphaerales bacterium]